MVTNDTTSAASRDGDRPKRRGHRLRYQRALLRQLQGRARHARFPSRRARITAFIGPSGCGKSTVLRCLNRMNDLVRGFRFSGHVHFRGKDIYHPTIDPVAVRRHIGMVFQQPNPFAMSIYRNVTFGLRLNGFKGDKAEQGRGGAARRRPLGRGQGQAAQKRPGPLRRPAAAALHRPGHRHGTRRAPDGRALFGAGSHRHAEDRRTDVGTEEALHDRHRHAQPAAGPARGRQDRLSLRRYHARRPHRLPRRVRRHQADLRGPSRTVTPRSTSAANSAKRDLDK